MSEETTLQASYLLHYTPWRDTSFIVDLFTFEHGRLGLMAKGARGGKSRTRALYQPFRPLLVSWFGDGELRTLTGIEESGAIVPLEGAALASAYYLNELVLRLLGKEQPQPELFAHYALALAGLAGSSTGDAATGPVAGRLETTLRTFELQLLETIGVLPDLARCAPGGRAIEAGARYRFHPANALAVPVGGGADADVAGGLAIPKRPTGDAVAEHDVHPDGVTRDEGIEVGGRTLLDMAALDFSDAGTREEAKTLMRRLVAGQLGGQPLRSRSMFEALVPPPPPPPANVGATPDDASTTGNGPGFAGRSGTGDESSAGGESSAGDGSDSADAPVGDAPA